ncbi:ROK family protein [Paenibacillus oleatilyticus]|uniref:ROK family protein n=1 Tax=Paenibacillus oleatilyticus TaxID=2594886 RepID=A0ABV4V804_9BACL
MRKVVLGIDLGGTNIKAGIVDDSGEVLKHTVTPTQAEQGRDALLGRLRAIIEDFRAHAASTGLLPLGIGVGTAGYVEPLSGRVAYATPNLPGWTGLQLREALEQASSLPVAVANDAHAMAVGEAWLGAGRPYRDFICVTLGTGVGGSRIIDGRPDYGGSGFAGGFGHMVIAWRGQPCNCGLSGCYEQYASVTALLRLAAEAGLRGVELPDGAKSIFDLAASGHHAASVVIERYAEYAAVGLISLAHVLHPQAIVLGGAVTAQGDALLGRIRRIVRERAMPVYRETPIVAAELGNAAGVAGAAKLAWDRLSGSSGPDADV